MTLVTQSHAHALQGIDMFGVALDIGEQRHIVATMDARKLRLQPGAELAVGAGLT